MNGKRPTEEGIVPESSNAFEFHKTEYERLKHEQVLLMENIATLARYAAIVSALIYSSLVSTAIGADVTGYCLKIPPGLFAVGWTAPVILVAVCCVGCFIAYQRADEFGQYFSRIENEFARHELGWERFLNARQLQRHAPSGALASDLKSQPRSRWVHSVWFRTGVLYFGLLVAGVLIAWFIGYLETHRFALHLCVSPKAGE